MAKGDQNQSVRGGMQNPMQRNPQFGKFAGGGFQPSAQQPPRDLGATTNQGGGIGPAPDIIQKLIAMRNQNQNPWMTSPNPGGGMGFLGGNQGFNEGQGVMQPVAPWARMSPDMNQPNIPRPIAQPETPQGPDPRMVELFRQRGAELPPNGWMPSMGPSNPDELIRRLTSRY